MRWARVIGFHSVKFDALHDAGLALQLLFQTLQQLALLDHDFVQLVDMAFQMGDVRFEMLHSLNKFVVHRISSFAARHLKLAKTCNNYYMF